MRPAPYSFARQFIGVVAAALIPVVAVTFWSIPLNLGGHPGEPRAVPMAFANHMT